MCTLNVRGPTRSREARRPPRRCRVPSTRRTTLRRGRSPRSRSHIPPGPPATQGAWSSAPGWELGRTLAEHGKETLIKLNDCRIRHSLTQTAGWFAFAVLRRFHVFSGVRRLVTKRCDDNTTGALLSKRLTELQLRVVFRGAHHFPFRILRFTADVLTVSSLESSRPLRWRQDALTDFTVCCVKNVRDKMFSLLSDSLCSSGYNVAQRSHVSPLRNLRKT